MTNRCAEVQLLLPWIVNKNLEPEQKVAIYSHLTECSQCKKDFAFFVELQQAVQRFMAKPELSLKKEILKKIVEEISPDPTPDSAPSFVQNVFCNPAPLKVFESIVRWIFGLYRQEYHKFAGQFKSGLMADQIQGG